MDKKLDALRKAIKDVRENMTSEYLDEYIAILATNYDDATNQQIIWAQAEKLWTQVEELKNKRTSSS